LCISGISTGLEEISERLGDCGGLAKPTTLEPASDDANADASTGTGDAANKADSSKLTIIIAAAAKGPRHSRTLCTLPQNRTTAMMLEQNRRLQGTWT